MSYFIIIYNIEKNLLYNFIVEPKNQKAEIKEEFTSEQKIKKAVEFHLNNKYDSKMNNISLHGVSSPLNKALIKNHEFSLTLEELKKAHQLVKNQEKNIGRRL